MHRTAALPILVLSSLFLLTIGAWPPAVASHDYQLRLKARELAPAAGVDPALSAYVGSTGKPRVHCIVQFTHIPYAYELSQFEALGGALQEHLPNYAYFASLPNQPAALTSLAALPFVRAMVFIQAADKTDPELIADGIPAWASNGDGTANLRVAAHPDVSISDAIAAIEAHATGGFEGPDRWLSYVAYRVPEGDLAGLAAEDAIQWVEAIPEPVGPQNDLALVASSATDLFDAPYALRGSALHLGIMDVGAVSKGHVDFIPAAHEGDANPEASSRVVFQEAGICNLMDHSTHVAGTMAGDGGKSHDQGGRDKQWRGILDQADIYSYAFNNYGVCSNCAHCNQCQNCTGGPCTVACNNCAGCGTPDEANELYTAIGANGLDLVNNSWGIGGNASVYGDYQKRTSEFDDVVRARWAPLVFSAGNEGCGAAQHNDTLTCTALPDAQRYGSLTPPGGTGKNTIVVGAVHSDTLGLAAFSSWGPTDDGRIKPDVVAAGDQLVRTYDDNWEWDTYWSGGVKYHAGDSCTVSTVTGNAYYNCWAGTSMAAPVVSGIGGAIIEAWKASHAQAMPRSSTVRAILAQTALTTDAPVTAPATAPDYRRGWGLACGTCSVQVVRRGSSSLEWAVESYLSTAGGMEFPFTMKTDSPYSPRVRVTLAWDDRFGAVNANPALVNDLDLYVDAPDGTRYYPFSLDPANPANAPTTNGPNTRDNLEQVNLPWDTVHGQLGTWKVGVTSSYLVDKQHFSLVLPYQPLKIKLANASPWHGLSADAGRTGFSVSTIPSTGHVLWSTPLGAAVKSSPAVDRELLFIGAEDGYVRAIEKLTGTVSWSQFVGSPVRSSPAVDGGFVVIGGGDGKIHAFDRDTGSPAWTYDPPGGPDPAVDSSPVVAAGRVFVGTGASLAALDVRTGSALWPPVTLAGAVHASPAVMQDTVYVGTDAGTVHAVNAFSGATLWTRTVGGSVRGGLAAQDGLVYVATTTATLSALSATSGTIAWGPITIGGPAHGGIGVIFDPMVFVGTDSGDLIARNALTGASMWTHTAGGSVRTSPAVGESAVIFGSSTGFVRAVSVASGQTLWTATTTGAVSSSPAIDAGMVFAATEGGRVYAIADDTDGDGVPDVTDDCETAFDPAQVDTDGDGSGDACDTDDDGDGLSDALEAAAGTNPLAADTDGDRLSDGEEVARGTNPLLFDTDGDGVGDADDCEPLDASVFSEPPEVGGLVFTSNTTMAWNAPGGGTGTRLDVLRGDLASLPVGPGGGDETCVQENLAALSTTDATIPSPGSGFWYVVRGDNRCGEGTYGFQGLQGSPGAERVSSTCQPTCGAGQTCAPGQHCSAGTCVCDSLSCPSGCCQGATCTSPSFSACGLNGAACVACGSTADSCVGGVCRCDGGPACAAGQRCAGGVCVCDATSCPSGCCQGTTCTAPSASACGTNGAACVACGSTADSCVGGVCRCDGGPACAAGQRCAGGICVCDATSCPSGCCQGTTCTAPSASACGLNGAACVACGSTADSCVGGVCRCDGGPACAAGQRCAGGICVCDATSCPSGCCQGTTCTAPSASACGLNGAACVACGSTADSCVGGVCRCDGGPACAAGQRCAGGVCVCDATSCPSGCCQGTTCTAPSASACGLNGAACVACGSTADSCVGGVCRCDGGPACAAGQRCAGGVCVCDATSCPGGCCQGATCTAPSASACGINGAACVACGSTADSCVGGVCRCDGGAACAAGQRCAGGVCVCDAASCPSGCCLGNVCKPGIDPQNCGTGGAACTTCTGGTTCIAGVCACPPGLAWCAPQYACVPACALCPPFVQTCTRGDVSTCVEICTPPTCPGGYCH